MLIGKTELALNLGSVENYGAAEGSVNLSDSSEMVDNAGFGEEDGDEEAEKPSCFASFKGTVKSMTIFDWIRLLLVMAIISSLLIIGGLALLPNSPVLVVLQEILNYIQNLPLWLAGALMIELYAFLIPIGCPITPLNLVSGFLFGVWAGFVIAISGTLLGSVVCFMWSLTLMREWAEAKLKTKRIFRAIEHGTHENAMKLIILTHLSPIMPTSILNYLFATMGVDFVRFVIGTFFGVTPLMFMAVYVGSLSADLAQAIDGSDTPAWQYVGSILLVVITSVVLILLLAIIGKREIGTAMKEIDRVDALDANVRDPTEEQRAQRFLREDTLML